MGEVLLHKKETENILNIAICEDERPQQRIIEDYINKFTAYKTFEISKYDSGEALISYYKQGGRFDIIFLDIKMKELDGIETAQVIRHYDERVYIILTTSLIEYAIKGYSVKANEFILKPINEQNFKSVFRRALKENNPTKISHYIIENRNEKIVINNDDIYYLESIGRKIRVNTKEGNFEHYKNISDEEKKLKNIGFIRTHRAFLVNMENIYRIHATEIVLKNKELVPLSKKRHKQVYDEFTTYMIGRFK